MVEYIERDAICYQLEKQESIDGQPRAIRRARRIVADFPAADVVPVRHGRWVHPVPGDGEPYCSVCHAEAEYFYGYGSFEPDFCPKCGAKMDNDKEVR